MSTEVELNPSDLCYLGRSVPQVHFNSVPTKLYQTVQNGTNTTRTPGIIKWYRSDQKTVKVAKAVQSNSKAQSLSLKPLQSGDWARIADPLCINTQLSNGERVYFDWVKTNLAEPMYSGVFHCISVLSTGTRCISAVSIQIVSLFHCVLVKSKGTGYNFNCVKTNLAEPVYSGIFWCISLYFKLCKEDLCNMYFIVQDVLFHWYPLKS